VIFVDALCSDEDLFCVGNGDGTTRSGGGPLDQEEGPGGDSASGCGSRTDDGVGNASGGDEGVAAIARRAAA